MLQNNTNQDDDSEVFFWDPPSAKNRNAKNQNHARQLQEQLAQATVKICDLETELKRVQKVEYCFSVTFNQICQTISLANKDARIALINAFKKVENIE